MRDKPTEALHSVRLLAMDVDGVLTDGSIVYDGEGRDLKRFHVADGLGLTLLRFAQVQVAWITGRTSGAVAQRACELKIGHVLQGVKDKGAALSDLAGNLGFSRSDVAFIGDDWNDLPAFDYAGVRIAVSNAAAYVRAAADFVTELPGGAGAVREVCDDLLEAKGLSNEVLSLYLASLKETRMEGSVGQ